MIGEIAARRRAQPPALEITIIVLTKAIIPQSIEVHDLVSVYSPYYR